MAAAPPQHQAELARLYRLAREDATHGVVDQTHKVRLRYWTHWSNYIHRNHPHLDPFLRGVEDPTRVDILSGFARFVREGHAGRGHQVRAGSVQAALCAVGQAFELDCRANPLYQKGAYGTYWRYLRSIIDCYKNEDPATSPKLAVPVKITEHLLTTHRHKAQALGPNARREAIADLINIAFYFLLRVGEYTHSKTKRRTVPFRVQDATFRDAEGHQIPNTAPLHHLLQAAEATLRIHNQKSGIKGQCIHVECTGNQHSPIKSLARRIHHIVSNDGPPSTPIYAYKLNPTAILWKSIDSTAISTTLKDAAQNTGLYHLGYTRNDISSHSLRAGGAMAMHLNGIDTVTIQKQGRWRSTTFLMCIHEQISAFATGVSTKMSRAVPFRHIAGPSLQPALAAATT